MPPRRKEHVSPSGYRWRGRRVWVAANGPIPKGYHLHHKDGDFTNNTLENLELVDAWAHNSQHHRGPLYHIPRHMRPAAKARRAAYGRSAQRRAYMRDYRQRKRDRDILSWSLGV